jgi:hypothetical protein
MSPAVDNMVGKSQTYSVVGVRADSSQHIMSMKLAHDDATYLKDVLLNAGIFQEVFIQPDDPRSARQGVECRTAET